MGKSLNKQSRYSSHGDNGPSVAEEVLANTQTAEVDDVEFGEGFGGEIGFSAVTLEDEQCVERLAAADLSYAFVSKLLLLINGELSDDQMESVLADLEKKECKTPIKPLTSAGLVEYIKRKPGASVSEKIRSVIEKVEGTARNLYMLHVETERAEAANAADGDGN